MSRTLSRYFRNYNKSRDKNSRIILPVVWYCGDITNRIMMSNVK
jgi:hypothetical protein